MTLNPSKHISFKLLNIIIFCKSLFENFLILIVRILTKTKKNNLPHTVNIPTATYAPWKKDLAFLSTYRLIKEYTLVDIYKLYDNWKIIEQVSSINGDLIEVGVWKGGSGCIIGKKLQNEGINATLHLCDTFEGVVKATNLDNKYTGGEFSDTDPIIVKNVAEKIGLKHINILKGIFPEETGRNLAKRKFRLCHIDVDTYQSAKDIFEWVWPKLNKGGVVIFDDYGGIGCEGITNLVNELGKKPDNIFIHNLNGHGILFKI